VKRGKQEAIQPKKPEDCAVLEVEVQMLTEDEVRENLRLYSDGKLIREPSASEVENKMRRLEEEEQKPIQPNKPEDCPICWRVWRRGVIISSGYSPEDDPEAVAEKVKDIMASGVIIEQGIPVYGIPVPYDPPYKILVYKLATVLEVGA